MVTGSPGWFKTACSRLGDGRPDLCWDDASGAGWCLLSTPPPAAEPEPPSGLGAGMVGCGGGLSISTLASTMAEPVVSVPMAAVSLGRAQHRRHRGCP